MPETQDMVFEVEATTPEPPPADPTPDPSPESPAADPGETSTEGETPESPAPPDPAAAEATEAGRKLSGRKKSLQQRLDEVTWEREEHRRRAEQAELRLKELEAQRTPAASPADPEAKDPEPTLEQFETYEDWVKAHTKWTARDVAREEFRAWRERDERAQADRALEQRHLTIQQKGLEKHADFVAVLSEFAQQGGRLDPFMTDVVLHHELGHEVAYALVTDPEAYRRIQQAPTFAHASIEMGKLLARLEAAPTGSASPTVPTVTRAHPPITPVGGAPVVTDTDPTALTDFDEYVARQDAKERAAGRRR